MSLTPFTATVLLAVAVIFGTLFRTNWKNQPKNWVSRAWVFGLISGISLLMLGFIPLEF